MRSRESRYPGCLQQGKVGEYAPKEPEALLHQVLSEYERVRTESLKLSDRLINAILARLVERQEFGSPQSLRDFALEDPRALLCLTDRRVQVGIDHLLPLI